MSVKRLTFRQTNPKQALPVKPKTDSALAWGGEDGNRKSGRRLFLFLCALRHVLSGRSLDPTKELFLRHDLACLCIDPAEKLFFGDQNASAVLLHRKVWLLYQLISSGSVDSQYPGHIQHGKHRWEFIIGFVIMVIHITLLQNAVQ